MPLHMQSLLCSGSKDLFSGLSSLQNYGKILIFSNTFIRLLQEHSLGARAEASSTQPLT
jgi:hypothetical protein